MSRRSRRGAWLWVAAFVAGCGREPPQRSPDAAGESVDAAGEPSERGPRVVTDGPVTTIDLLSSMGLEVNAAGPILVQADASRNRVIVANTLSSSMTIIDGATDAVRNIPLERRGLQHLKGEAMVIHAGTGHVYLLADHALIVVDPDRGAAKTFATDAQFESVTVDPATGNAFFCGRESGQLGFYAARSGEVRMLPWLEHEEALGNLNQTPPPPLRRVVAVPSASEGGPGRIAAIDGFEATLHLFDARNGRALGSRALPLQPGGRWHLAGVDPETRHAFLLTETVEREAIQVGKIAVDGEDDVVVPLPKLEEPVGMTYNPARKEVYIPYDNHPTLHVVDFRAEGGGELVDVAIPAYGNDAAAIDVARDRVYLASWVHGEVEIVDLAARRFVGRIRGQGILPHMFAMTFNAANGDLYLPVGASAVNGCFGASVTRLDPDTGEARTIRTGWAPIDLIEAGERFLVFDNEDRMAEVTATGQVRMHELPHRFPSRAVHGPEDLVYLAYGPHQSYWPVVYIWAARNGILAIDPDDLSTHDRRIPRQPLDLAYVARHSNRIVHLDGTAPEAEWERLEPKLERALETAR